MTESTPPEGGQQQPLTQAQIWQLRRSLTEKVLDKAASDPEWRQLLIEDPELAMREANFPEAQQLGQQGLPMRSQEREVVGQGGGEYYPGYVPGCRYHRAPPRTQAGGYWTDLARPSSRCVRQTLFYSAPSGI